jgi:hypothetical protein
MLLVLPPAFVDEDSDVRVPQLLITEVGVCVFCRALQAVKHTALLPAQGQRAVCK